MSKDSSTKETQFIPVLPIIVQKKHMKKTVTYYLVSLFFHNITKVLPHAVLTALLLQKGMNLSQISLIQSSYMLATFIFEVPSGIISDVVSEKTTYILSIITMLIAYLIIPHTDSLYILVLAWFIYGLSSAFMSGSLDTYFIKDMNQDKHDIKKFNIGVNYVLITSSILGSLTGLALFPYIGLKIYYLSLLFLPISLYFAVHINYDKKNIGSRNDSLLFTKILPHIREMCKLINNKPVIKIVYLVIVFQIMVLAYYQYWQVIFLDRGYSTKITGIVYIVIQLFSIISNKIFSIINIKNNAQKNILLLVMTISFYLYLNTSIGIVFFFLFQIFFNIYNHNLTVILYSSVTETYLSTFISAIGVMISLFSFIFLFSISIIIKHIDTNIILTISTFTVLFLSYFISPYKVTNNE